jgi:hypothetical protein
MGEFVAANIETESDFRYTAFRELVTIANRSGLQIHLGKRDIRREAIAFIVEEMRAQYLPVSENGWQVPVQALIAKAQAIGENAIHVSNFFNDQFDHVYTQKLTSLAAQDAKHLINFFDALLKLHKTIRSTQDRAKIVYFGGLPGDLVPQWCDSYSKKLESEFSDN